MPLNLCACGLAKHYIAVSTSTGDYTAYLCEHCDQYCTGCKWCVTLSRSQAGNKQDK